MKGPTLSLSRPPGQYSLDHSSTIRLGVVLVSRKDGQIQVQAAEPGRLPEGVVGKPAPPPPRPKNPIGSPHTKESRSNLSVKAKLQWRRNELREARAKRLRQKCAGSQAEAEDVEHFIRLHCKRLREEVGGGRTTPPGVKLLVESAALHRLMAAQVTALARKKADPKSYKTASEFLAAMRNDLLAAHELTARSAKAAEAREAMRAAPALSDDVPAKPKPKAKRRRPRKPESLED